MDESRLFRDDDPPEYEIETFHFPDLPADDLENVSMECKELSGSPREDSDKMDVDTMSKNENVDTSQENCEKLEFGIDFADNSRKEQSSTVEMDMDFGWDDPNKQTLMNSLFCFPIFSCRRKSCL